MLVEFKDQPELGIWWMTAQLAGDCTIQPTDKTPAGLAELGKCATISVRRSTLRLYRPTQTERLF